MFTILRLQNSFVNFQNRETAKFPQILLAYIDVGKVDFGVSVRDFFLKIFKSRTLQGS